MLYFILLAEFLAYSWTLRPMAELLVYQPFQFEKHNMEVNKINLHFFTISVGRICTHSLTKWITYSVLFFHLVHFFQYFSLRNTKEKVQQNGSTSLWHFQIWNHPLIAVEWFIWNQVFLKVVGKSTNNPHFSGGLGGGGRKKVHIFMDIPKTTAEDSGTIFKDM